jgi:hypothetical protein
MPANASEEALFNSIFGDLPKETQYKLRRTITAIEKKIYELEKRGEV